MWKLGIAKEVVRIDAVPDEIKALKAGDEIVCIKSHVYYKRDLADSAGEGGEDSAAPGAEALVTDDKALHKFRKMIDGKIATRGSAAVLTKINTGECAVFKGWADRTMKSASVEFKEHGVQDVPVSVLSLKKSAGECAAVEPAKNAPDIRKCLTDSLDELKKKIGETFKELTPTYSDFNVTGNKVITGPIERAGTISPTLIGLVQQKLSGNQFAYFKAIGKTVRVYALEDIEAGQLVVFPWATQSAFKENVKNQDWKMITGAPTRCMKDMKTV